MEEITFQTAEELYKRVKPALKAKRMELKRLGFLYIKEEDIWNYLKETKWKSGKDLNLCDIVDDILHISNQKLDQSLKEKWAKQKRTLILDDTEEKRNEQ